jgi:hypothetical protein
MKGREMIYTASLDVDAGNLSLEVRGKNTELDCTTPCGRVQHFRGVLRWRHPEGLTKCVRVESN